MDKRAHALLRHIAERLRGQGIDNPEKEAELIVTSCTAMDRVALYRDDPPVDEEAAARIGEMVARRLEHEPLAYITGRADFYGLEIGVGPGVLVPRPETELIVTELLHHLPRPGTGLRILDLCAGSGCLALAIARELPESRVYGTEISEAALAYARKNARLNGIENAEFLKGDLFNPVEGVTFDAIVSNPPYIRRDEIDTLMPEIRYFEPREALDGGEDGLRYHRAIIGGAPQRLREDGLLLLEMGLGQSEDVAGIILSAGLRVLATIKDLCHIDRVIVAQK